MGKKVRRVDFHPDELIAAVAGNFSPYDFGVYWMICTLIASKRGPIDSDPAWLSGLFRKRTRTSEIKAAIERLKAAGKLTEKDGKLSQERMVDELDNASNRIRKATENGRKGGRPRREAAAKPELNGSQSAARVEPNGSQSAPRVRPNCSLTETKGGKVSRENRGLGKAPGFSDEKLTTNHQPPTTNQQSNDSFAEDAAGLLEGFSDLCVEILGKAPNACMSLAPREMTVAKELMLAGLSVSDVLARARRPLERKRDRGEGPPGSLAYVRDAVLDERAGERDAKSRLNDVVQQIEDLRQSSEGIKHQVAWDLAPALDKPVFRDALTDQQRALYDRLKTEQRDLEAKLGKALPRSA